MGRRKNQFDVERWVRSAATLCKNALLWREWDTNSLAPRNPIRSYNSSCVSDIERRRNRKGVPRRRRKVEPPPLKLVTRNFFSVFEIFVNSFCVTFPELLLILNDNYSYLFCASIYGCESLSGSNINSFCRAWRKRLQRVCVGARDTHSDLLYMLSMHWLASFWLNL